MSTSQTVALGFLVVWTASSVGLGLVMRRRGYSGFGWGVIGAVLGPIAILLALTMQRPRSTHRWDKAGLPALGTVDVLIGTDGSAASIEAAKSAVELLERRLRKVTIAVVAPFDATPEETGQARSALHATRAAIADHLLELDGAPGTIVLHGPAADTLRHFAVADGYDLIVIGSHGHGASKAVLGSVAAALVDHSPVPLVVAGRKVTGRRWAPAAEDERAGAA